MRATWSFVCVSDHSKVTLRAFLRVSTGSDFFVLLEEVILAD